MARKYTIQLTQAIADFAAAIADYYGTGNYTIYYQDTQYLVFSIPAISNKVLRIRIVYNDWGGHFNYGDEWTSGSTITNDKSISLWFEKMNANGLLVLSQYHLQYFNNDAKASTIIVGQLSNDEYVGIGIQNSTSNIVRSTPRLMTDDSLVAPLFPSIPYSNALTPSTNKLLTFPCYILHIPTATIKEDSVGNPVYIKGVRVCKYSSIFDNDNVVNYYMNGYYDQYTSFGVSTIGFFSEIDNYTL
jgi:hypothetical protein